MNVGLMKSHSCKHIYDLEKIKGTNEKLPIVVLLSFFNNMLILNEIEMFKAHFVKERMTLGWCCWWVCLS